MKHNYISAAGLAILVAISSAQTVIAESIAQDLTTICGWYNTLVSDEKYKNASTEVKFQYAFDDKNILSIHYIAMQDFYSALRTTDANQRYDLMQAYAEGTLGKKWECPTMKEVMQQFKSLDRKFQYSR